MNRVKGVHAVDDGISCLACPEGVRRGEEGEGEKGIASDTGVSGEQRTTALLHRPQPSPKQDNPIDIPAKQG